MFVKLYSSMILSSVWSEDPEVRVLWITMLATADRDGFLFGSPAGLAAVARLPIEAVHRGLKKFTEPDPESSDLLRNPENEGRRIEAIDGGWKLLNYDFYRGLERAEDRRAQYRESKRRTRARKAVDRPRMSPRVSKTPPSEAEAEAVIGTLPLNGSPPVQQNSSGEGRVSRRSPRPRSNGFHPPSVPEVRKWVAETHPEWLDARIFDAVKFCAHYDSVGWIVGKKRMVNWHAAAVGWAVREEERRLNP